MIACFRPHVISSVFVLLGGDQTDHRYVHRWPERTDEGLSVPATQGYESDSLLAISPGKLDTDPYHIPYMDVDRDEYGIPEGNPQDTNYPVGCATIQIFGSTSWI